MRIHEILLERAKKEKHKAKAKAKKHHDLDDEEDESPQDADQDTVPHIVMQLKKAKDVAGDYPITFKDGKKIKLSISDIEDFLKKYESLKPYEKEEFQSLASKDIHGFHAALKKETEKKPEHKIKGTRYMSSFAGDFDDK